ncbi:hypothetical protein K8R04_00390 [Candidatus Uhrbacteria bacterium]|nr:hypothetical protein [Candidatus Uhrbacteria bacterium]
MTDQRKSNPLRSATSSLDDILKGEVLTRLPHDATPDAIDAMTVQARRRFAPNALWTIGAIEVERIEREARERLKVAFDEFRNSNGALIVVITGKQAVASTFRMVAIQARNIPLKIAKDLKESNELSAAHRATYNKP